VKQVKSVKTHCRYKPAFKEYPNEFEIPPRVREVGGPLTSPTTLTSEAGAGQLIIPSIPVTTKSTVSPHKPLHVFVRAAEMGIKSQ
jgi:hypothetical protein